MISNYPFTSLTNIGLLSICVLILTACGEPSLVHYKLPKQGAAPKPSSLAQAQVSELPTTAAADMGAFIWDAPATWEEGKSSSMRIGSFSATINGEDIDISIIKLGGDGGGHLANVNRWRGQIGLGPLDDATMAATMKPLRDNCGPKLS